MSVGSVQRKIFKPPIEPIIVQPSLAGPRRFEAPAEVLTHFWPVLERRLLQEAPLQLAPSYLLTVAEQTLEVCRWCH
jgi:hypothetical protein